MSNVPLLIAIVAATAAVVGAIIAVANFVRNWPRDRKKAKVVVRMPRVWIPLLTMIICSTVAFWAGRASVRTSDMSQYGFESGAMGWTKETYSDTQGVTAVAQSSDLAKFGRHSLRLTLDLEGGHPNRSQGEAYVEIAPQNLNNKPITVWVYVPEGVVGTHENPNGIQLFVKDTDRKWRAEYGAWWNITRAKANDWQQVTLTPSTEEPPDGSMTPGFDPTQIRAVGIRAAIGAGSGAIYRGPIYIDALDWP